MRTIDEILDKAKKAQKVQSDYKLSLCVGIGESSLSAYRHKRALPDEINCKKLALAMGEDPALLTIEMMIQRSKTPEAKQIWVNIAKRLQSGFANVPLLLLVALFSIAALALPAWASVPNSVSSEVGSVYYVKARLRRITRKIFAFVKFRKVAANVPRNPHPPAFYPA